MKTKTKKISPVEPGVLDFPWWPLGGSQVHIQTSHLYYGIIYDAKDEPVQNTQKNTVGGILLDAHYVTKTSLTYQYQNPTNTIS